ncbi:MAG TPA: hypothetical protein VLW49_11965 [Gaiellaceae bacterium]|nr:hypothetical protein [Gaiellaceae bacterium]
MTVVARPVPPHRLAIPWRAVAALVAAVLPLWAAVPWLSGLGLPSQQVAPNLFAGSSVRVQPMLHVSEPLSGIGLVRVPCRGGAGSVDACWVPFVGHRRPR